MMRKSLPVLFAFALSIPCYAFIQEEISIYAPTVNAILQEYPDAEFLQTDFNIIQQEFPHPLQVVG